MSFWGKPIALLALVSSTAGGMKATAAVFTSIPTVNRIPESESTPFLQRKNLQLAQSQEGECRAAVRSTFIYQERSTANRIRALQPDERVTLAEERGRENWVAISSPISGFVRARDLKLCSDVSTPPSNLCRQVIYQGTEGLAVRERPDINSRRLGGVLLGDRVTLANPPRFREDNEGREWVRLSDPLSGWMSNGFPATGDLNLKACS